LGVQSLTLLLTASAHPGPNAPFKDCPGTSQPGASAEGAVKAWTDSKFPASHLLLGIPAYGYVSDSTATTISSKSGHNSNSNRGEDDSDSDSDSSDSSESSSKKHKSKKGKGKGKGNDSKKHSERDDVSTHGDFVIPASKGPSHMEMFEQGWAEARLRRSRINHAKRAGSGNLESLKGQQATFAAIIDGGALTESSDGKFAGANGYTRAWDDCSSTVRFPLLPFWSVMFPLAHKDGSSSSNSRSFTTLSSRPSLRMTTRTRSRSKVPTPPKADSLASMFGPSMATLPTKRSSVLPAVRWAFHEAPSPPPPPASSQTDISHLIYLAWSLLSSKNVDTVTIVHGTDRSIVGHLPCRARCIYGNLNCSSLTALENQANQVACKQTEQNAVSPICSIIITVSCHPVHIPSSTIRENGGLR
jgi:hypothetical protein